MSEVHWAIPPFIPEPSPSAVRRLADTRPIALDLGRRRGRYDGFQFYAGILFDDVGHQRAHFEPSPNLFLTAPTATSEPSWSLELARRLEIDVQAVLLGIFVDRRPTAQFRMRIEPWGSTLGSHAQRDLIVRLLATVHSEAIPRKWIASLRDALTEWGLVADLLAEYGYELAV